MIVSPNYKKNVACEARYRGMRQMRLFCFPYAGGGASIFRDWQRRLSPSVEVCPVQLPGREDRAGEEPYRRLVPMLEGLVGELGEVLDLPFIFFGHSMGASVAFELARFMRKLDMPLPLHLYLSGRGAPLEKDNNEPKVYNLPRERFIAILKSLNGTPDEVFESEELLDLVMPVLRADFEVLETIEYIPETPLSCPITAFGGSDDKSVLPDRIFGWSNQTSAQFDCSFFSGGHFFLKSSKDQFLRKLNSCIVKVLNGD